MRIGGERGTALVAAVVLLSAMLTLGMATVALVDGQQQESGRERTRDSGLNLAEGVLYAQAFVLARNWPAASAGVGGAYPDSCLSSAVTTTRCPDRNTLATSNSTTPAAANFTANDFAAGSTWITKVRDNGGALATFYDTTQADAAQGACPRVPCSLDYNGDRRLWVQVSTVVRGRPRSVAALLQLEEFKEAFPHGVITAGHLNITNNGNHGGRYIVDTTGSQIGVRCNPLLTSCVSYSAGQISTPSFQQLPASSVAALNPAQLDRLKSRAITDGHYFATCPSSSADLAGAVVWVENCSNNYANSLQSVACTAPLSGQCINTPAAPGILIWHQGTAKFTGNQTFVGLVYMVNDSDNTGGTSGTVLDIGGAFSVYGAVSIDGQGGLAVGSNADPNIKYDPNAFNAPKSYGTAGLVQNTWRELYP